ncbi:MAG TPA: hypothetical protein VJI98_06110 [Candidatus Nanoarchaeia archaeon]|nr:hypothetical protein [Candidatus Nanoarchaeia archaeon]
MNWKKVGLFALFLIIGIFLFALITFIGSFEVGYLTLFLPIFFIAFVVFLVLIMTEYSKKKLMIISLLIVVYWLIIVIPFPKCDSWIKLGGITQISLECTCIGFEKTAVGIYDTGWSQCVGFPINKLESKSKQSEIQEQIEQKILGDLIVNPDKKFSFLVSEFGFSLRTQQSKVIKFAVENNKNTPLSFTTKIEVRKPNGEIDNSALNIRISDIMVIRSGEVKTFDLLITSTHKTDDYLINLKIIDVESPEIIYAENNLGVVVIE